MKEIFLSFKPKYFKPLLYGMKKYEYRKRFCNEDVRAYLYLSDSKKEVIGYMDLLKPLRIDCIKDSLHAYPDTLKRVEHYIQKRDIYAIPIKNLVLFKKPLTLAEIRKIIPNFMPPQMYYILENNLGLKDLLKKQELDYKVFEHNHSDIYYDNLAMSVQDMEETEEFIKLEETHKLKGSFSSIHF